MRRQFLFPAPLPLLRLLLIHDPHSPPHLALHSPNPTRPLPLNILPHHPRRPLHPPLRPGLLDPERSFTGAPTPRSLDLLLLLRLPCTAREQLGNFLHSHVGREGRHLRLVDAGVFGSGAVFVFWQLAPHAAVDAVAEAGEVGCGRRGGGSGGGGWVWGFGRGV